MPQRPATSDRDAWRNYWQARSRPWRIEPEIDDECQVFLTKQRAITSDSEQGIYPFKEIKMTRAGVEWLLATYDGGRGPIDWNDESQCECKGLDLRRADLRQVNLRGLPMACLCGGFSWYQGTRETAEQLDSAGIALQRADLRETHLEAANSSRDTSRTC